MTTESLSFDPVPFTSKDLNISAKQVAAVAKLFAEGNTIPFIARYRKEVHGNLDEVQITDIQEKLAYYNTLNSRRQTILKSIEEQDKLSDELRLKIEECQSKTELEDLYLPYKPKRRTRAMIAKEKGLEPLAELILTQASSGNIDEEAAKYISEEKEVKTTEDALKGARDIIAEQISERAEVRAFIRKAYFKTGIISSTSVGSENDEDSKYKDYFDFSQPINKIPSHRYLAIRRGETEGILRRKLTIDAEPQLERIKTLTNANPSSPFFQELDKAIQDAYKRLLTTSVEVDVSVEMKLKADRSAVDIFAKNLRNLLMAAPYGEKAVIGIDPGLRTGCKCVALDATGKYLDTITIYVEQGDAKTKQANIDLSAFIEKHQPQSIAIGNGTAGRETESFVQSLLKDMQADAIKVVSVSEAGASVYSASPIARDEFPDLDLTIRGAISIARRLQDPLAELVKVDPKSIGVGQYQHDVYQQLLKDKLDEVVVSCVNHVGVELNTASAPLLSRVAGIGDSLAKKVINYRNENGAFKSRKDLLKVSGLGPRAFEQAAGFLRIHGGEQPLDASAVHPERYALVETIATDLNKALEKLVGDVEVIKQIKISNYVSDDVGELTLKDIIDELNKPGRDPREKFEAVGFREDVMTMKDLKEGMELKGVVTNVTAFGAFVDIGVHQDGLVHISQLSDQFIKDPADVVQAGDKIDVRVLEVNLKRKRISLTAKKKQNNKPVAKKQDQQRNNKPQGQRRNTNRNNNQRRNKNQRDNKPSGFFNNPFGDL